MLGISNLKTHSFITYLENANVIAFDMESLLRKEYVFISGYVVQQTVKVQLHV